MADVIVVDTGSGGWLIAKARREESQYPTISPRHYREVARVHDVNDVGRVARAFGWEPAQLGDGESSAG